MMHNQENNIDTSRRENITGRNHTSTGRITNKQKIYNYLLEQNKTLTTTEISNMAKIDIKNISRYLKALESEGLIIRNTIQKGKRRLVYVEIKNDQFKEIITSRKKDDMTRNDPTTNRRKSSKDQEKSKEKGIREDKMLKSNFMSHDDLTTSRKSNDTSSNENIGVPGAKNFFISEILTVNSIFEEIIKYSDNKTGKGYRRINKILKSHDKNRNYQSNILRDVIEILIEMKRVR